MEDAESAARWNDLQYVDRVLLNSDLTADQVTSFYKEWAHSGTYEQIMRPSAYGCPLVLQQIMMDLYPSDRETLRILEVGAGTGLAGQQLHDAGFTNLDGLDPNKDMLEVARQKKVYRQLFNMPLTGDPTDIPADSYDAVMLAGVILHGHLPCDAFLEMTRLVRSGGYIVNCMRASYLGDIPEYSKRWDTLMAHMIQEKKWKVIKYEKYANHFLGREGLLMVFQVTK